MLAGCISGDEMRLNGGGNLWFWGRRKQIAVHDGSSICPQDGEEALADHPAVELAELIAFARERVGYGAPEAPG